MITCACGRIWNPDRLRACPQCGLNAESGSAAGDAETFRWTDPVENPSAATKIASGTAIPDPALVKCECGRNWNGQRLSACPTCGRNRHGVLVKAIPDPALVQCECGRDWNTNRLSACPSCGRNTRTNAADDTRYLRTTNPFCHRCGAALLADALFCSRCGTGVPTVEGGNRSGFVSFSDWGTPAPPRVSPAATPSAPMEIPEVAPGAASDPVSFADWGKPAPGRVTPPASSRAYAIRSDAA